MPIPPFPARDAAIRRVAAAIAVAAPVVALDQITKFIVVERMNLRELGEIEFLPVLDFRMAWNTGVNFGLMASHAAAGRWFLIVFATALATVLIAASAWQTRRIRTIGLGIAAGGAIGNLIDRLHYGAVADFLNVSGFGIENPWSFNVADIAVFAGFALVLWPLPDKHLRQPAR